MTLLPSPALRPAVTGDAQALAALDAIGNPNPWTARQFSDAGAGTPGRERVLVAAGAGQILGFVVYSQLLDEASIYNVAVAPDSRRQGLGERLLRAALTRAREAGASRCLLELRASNGAALCLYRKLGFQPDGLRKGYYSAQGGREDAILMSVSLGELETKNRL